MKVQVQNIFGKKKIKTKKIVNERKTKLLITLPWSREMLISMVRKFSLAS